MMRPTFQLWQKIFLVQLLFLVGCATQLAPAYDKNVADGLNASSVDAMTLFATMSSGTKAQDFSTRADRYASLIGKLDALALAAGARPLPKNKVTDSINRFLEKRGASVLSDDDATPPSAHAIRQISATLSKMRDTDQKQGVTAYEVIAFKGQASIYFDQAITYENFLQR
ncbi:hypothetical protein [Undibacterium danionis]|uniref:Lipoprotein n=1 Tax=Undibacterium danionis TaxID=1812100 RepID=A0ABV6IAK5_9BURK